MFKVHKKSYQSPRKKRSFCAVFPRVLISLISQFFFLIRLSQPIPLLERAWFFSQRQQKSKFLRAGCCRGCLCVLFVCLLSLSPLDSPVLEPHLNLMFCKSNTQRQVITFAFVQVVLKLKAAFQSLALVVRENRTGPGCGVSLPCCTTGNGVRNINTLTKQV